MSNGIIPFPMKPNGGAGGDLPTGYRRLEYVRFDKQQIINTGISMSDPELRIVMDFQTYDPRVNDEMILFGSRYSGYIGSPMFSLYYRSAETTSFIVGCWQPYKEHKLTDIPNGFYTRHTVTFDKSYIQIDDNRKDFEPPVFIEVNYPFRIGYDQVNRQLRAKVWSVQLYSGAKLACNLIPAQDKDGVVCLYDAVGKRALYSEGARPLLGPE